MNISDWILQTGSRTDLSKKSQDRQTDLFRMLQDREYFTNV